VGSAVVARCGCSDVRSWRRCGSWLFVNAVCVVKGVRDSEDVEEGCGRGVMPKACAAGMCVKKANGASSILTPFSFAGEVEDRDSTFGAALGCKSARSLAI
jgi:hypothetical protein